MKRTLIGLVITCLLMFSCWAGAEEAGEDVCFLVEAESGLFQPIGYKKLLSDRGGSYRVILTGCESKESISKVISAIEKEQINRIFLNFAAGRSGEFFSVLSTIKNGSKLLERIATIVTQTTWDTDTVAD